MKLVAYAIAIVGLAAGAVAAQDAAKPAKRFPLFADSDTDKDGFMTQAEWDASGRSPRRFLQVDADQEGRVGRGELHAATAAARAAAANQPKP